MGDDFANLAKLLPKIEESPPTENQSTEVGKADEGALKERLELEKITEEIRGLRQDIDERKKYAEKSFMLVVRWVLGVFVILLLQGFLSGTSTFKLADSVLLAVVGGTTVSIIGIFLVVANYLFPKR